MPASTSSSGLAIHGGRPVRPTYLPYGRQQVTEEDVQAVAAVLRSDYLTTGPEVPSFEAALASAAGTPRAVACSNGTAALDLMLRALRLPPGSEVVTTPLTFVATANACLYNGLRPVFADIDPDTLNINPDEAARRVTPRTKAILAVHFGGLPVKAAALRDLAEDKGLHLLEDAAHALGARSGPFQVGSIGKAATFSFHPVKHVTSGEGGAVTTADTGLAEAMVRLRSHGISVEAARRHGPTAGHYYEMVELGHNFRMTDIQAALGRSQLSRLAANVARRRQLADRYRSKLGSLVRFQHEAAGESHSYHLMSVQLSNEWRHPRDAVFRALRAENIGVNVHYLPVHLHPYYRQNLGTAPGTFPEAEAVYGRLLSLPMFHSMTDQDVDDTVAALEKVAAANVL